VKSLEEIKRENAPKYLGEFSVKTGERTGLPPTSDRPAWALVFVERYGGFDGSHHKQWVLDQVARILLGTPVELCVAKWDDGKKEYRFTTGAPSQSYLEWVVEMRAGEDGPNTYTWDEGIAP
jgi:hypothetical protein